MIAEALMTVLLWGCWSIINAWLAHTIYLSWRQYWSERNSGYRAPELRTFFAIEFVILSGAFMRVVVDHKPFFIVPGTNGFYDTGYGLAQIMCAIAWILAMIYSLRWGIFVFFARDSADRWALGSLYAIFLLFGSALILRLVFAVSF